MSNANIDQVLATMRAISAQASGSPQGARESSPVEFSQLLKQSIDRVNETQQQAGEMKEAFELGSGEADLAEVMIAVQKSSLSFEAMVQVRNKLVEAYKEVMNMPI
ncbi:MAG: flagellar hook-basal body complex protein FliE [Candidatus Sedimenticola endophacoides]|uniref:Flagellar hook-basal body complex protein FliE n=1 Tax=Candidatus Sedimenticola endophacoides TaxID=2548426 RepID=A0A657PYC7_9GAMM|nr:MAG: flagellar hook-basal body complex protein FliE [Candidatus Sedimenticola endophacoides]OQX37323.1 MAG: flagellar hook-basal body complex protein FliE [Candidatus Sedimenticola endophacoides]OQX38441.1 MAG: flagellar hook-basal body complex protein FliE [Candidatus Sedimenticola endophacoides]OQX38446.1 MAG: flagellar hook-basal body complex protein FliE [Candidatus Sedimenticola endophacoides]OQX38872.1 MAG: flagellar hook-basal body complex protein FliE [Candidatus Sedimenticola endoph